MLPDTTRLGAVRLRVRSLDRALQFYRDVLGLVPGEEVDGAVPLSARATIGGRAESPGDAGPSSQSAARGRVGETIVWLVADAQAVPKPPATTGLYHFAILVPTRRDLAHAFLRLYEARWPFQGFSDHAVSEAIYLPDPDGNGIEIYRDRPRSEWRRQGDEIFMTTRPLDIDALAAEIEGEESAQGLAPGTVIGHIHLHVADLARAEKFYHDMMGFAVTTRGYPGALFLAAGGYHHHIGMNTWAGVGAQPPPADAVGLIEYEIIVEDEEARGAIAARLEAGGFPVRREPGGRILRVRDPDGIETVVVPHATPGTG